jgi:gliding motility-associated protein GldE
LESDPYSYITAIILQSGEIHQTGLIIGLVVIFLLLLCSALISGSEVAYFSLSPKNIHYLESNKNPRHNIALKLLDKPEQLLATILVANNFTNIGIVIISTYVTHPLFTFIESETLTIIFQLVVITFILLLFGELMPKVYATRYPRRFAIFMSVPLQISTKIFWPISILLVNSTHFINKRLKKRKQNISMDELSQAIELASDDLYEEKNILEGIVNFSNIDVKAIMKPRMDVVGIELKETFNKAISVIIETGFSRLPVYEETFDNIKGVLYIKDLLPFLNTENKDEFSWQHLIRPYYQIPETKKINDLLEDFQRRKLHMAIVKDEYGGTSGIVTMEDILEEIVGEITDESDHPSEQFTKTGPNTWEFIAKTSLTDFCRIVDADYEEFEQIRGDSDSLAGLILELVGEIPTKNEHINFNKYHFKIIAVDQRRIKKIEVKILPGHEKTE